MQGLNHRGVAFISSGYRRESIAVAKAALKVESQSNQSKNLPIEYFATELSHIVRIGSEAT